MKNSKTYEVNGKQFRYDYDKALLCWVDEEFGIVDEIGLSRENWEDNPQYWCEVYAERIAEEISYLW